MAPFPVMFFFFGEQCNMEVELGAFFVWKDPIHPPTPWLIWPNRFGAVSIQFPSRHIAHRSAAGRPLGIIINISCEMSLRWPLSIIPSVFNVCVFCKGSPVSSCPAPSHLLWIHWPLGTLGSVCVEPEDGFVTHGAHAADLQPLKQAPDRTESVTV